MKEGLRRRLDYPMVERPCTLVLTVSEAARRENLTYFGLPAERVRCVYPGVASLCEDSRASASTRATGALCRIDFQPSACSGLSPGIQTDCDSPRGCATGDRGRQSHPPARRSAFSLWPLACATQVTIRPYAHDAQLSELYSRARAFALLSEYGASAILRSRRSHAASPRCCSTRTSRARSAVRRRSTSTSTIARPSQTR